MSRRNANRSPSPSRLQPDPETMTLNPPDGLQPSPQNDQRQSQPEPTTSALPPELQQIADQSHFGPSSGSADHLEALAGEVAASEPDAPSDGAMVDQAPIVSKEVFRASIIGGFNFGGLFLSAMKIQPEETEKANAAADALYDTALEVHWLRFLLDPSSVMIQRIIVIGSFVIPKTMAIMAEVKEKKKPKPIASPTNAGPVPVPKAGPRDREPGDGEVVSST